MAAPQTLASPLQSSKPTPASLDAHICSICDAVGGYEDHIEAAARDEPQAIFSNAVLRASASTITKRYVLGDECFDCLRDLKRFLRLDETNPARHVARLIGECHLVAQDLVPMLEHHSECPPIVEACLELLVPLTWPLPRVPPRTTEQGSARTQLLQHHTEAKKALAGSQTALRTIFEKILIQNQTILPARRTDRQSGLMRLAVCLMRNLLAIPDPDLAESVHSQLVARMHEIGITLYLFVAAGSVHDDKQFRPWAPLLVETIYMLLSPYDVRMLCPETAGQNAPSAVAEAASELLASEARRALRVPRRHTRFVGTFAVRAANGSRFHVHSHEESIHSIDARKQRHRPRPDLIPDGAGIAASCKRPPSKRHCGAGGGSENATKSGQSHEGEAEDYAEEDEDDADDEVCAMRAQARGRPLPNRKAGWSDPDDLRLACSSRRIVPNYAAQKMLRELAREVLERSLNPLLATIRADENRSDVTDDARAYATFLAQFFLEYQILHAHSKLPQPLPSSEWGLVAQALGPAALSACMRQLCQAHCDNSARMCHVTARWLLQIMQSTKLLASLEETNEDAERLRAAADSMLHVLCYERSHIDILLQVVRTAASKRAIRLGYACTLLEAVYAYTELLCLHANTKSGLLLMKKRQQKRRKSKKQKKQPPVSKEAQVADTDDDGNSKKEDNAGQNETELENETYRGSDDDSDSDSDAEAGTAVSERLFDFKAVTLFFCSVPVVTLCTRLLSYHENLPAAALSAIAGVIRLVAETCSSPHLFFNVRCLMSFQSVLESYERTKALYAPTATSTETQSRGRALEELDTVLRRVLRAFYARLAEYPLLLVEAMYPIGAVSASEAIREIDEELTKLTTSAQTETKAAKPSGDGVINEKLRDIMFSDLSTDSESEPSDAEESQGYAGLGIPNETEEDDELDDELAEQLRRLRAFPATNVVRKSG